MDSIFIQPITRQNWAEAVRIAVNDDQLKLVPSVIESLAYAYIRPWDEALDPFVLYEEDKAIGFFYISYTPKSIDNYWIGGFQIDKQFQGMGYGEKSLIRMIGFIKESHPACQIISLTVEKMNLPAQRLYEKIGFSNENKLNQDGEVIYKINLN